MASAVDVCNIALSHLGAEAQVASISPPDGSVEAGYCARFYPIARRVALEEFSWTFSKTRVELAQVTNPSNVWLYAYAMPSDIISALRVLNTTSLDGLLLSFGDSYLYPYSATYWSTIFNMTEASSANFEIEGDVLLTNEPEATLLYTRDVTDTTKFSPAFVSGVGMLLAGYLAGPIIKGAEGMRVGQAWTQSGMAALSKAATGNANESSERAEFIPQSIQARA